MWKRGKELVLHSSTTGTVDRIYTNLGGSILFILASVIGIVFILSYFKNNSTTDNVYVIIIPLAIMGCFDYLMSKIIYSSYFPEDYPITIGKNGIMIYDGTLYKWNDIEYAYYGLDETDSSREPKEERKTIMVTQTVPSKTSKPVSKHKQNTLEFLHVIYKNDRGETNHIQYEITGHIFDARDIPLAVECWGGRYY